MNKPSLRDIDGIGVGLIWNLGILGVTKLEQLIDPAFRNAVFAVGGKRAHHWIGHAGSILTGKPWVNEPINIPFDALFFDIETGLDNDKVWLIGTFQKGEEYQCFFEKDVAKHPQNAANFIQHLRDRSPSAIVSYSSFDPRNIKPLLSESDRQFFDQIHWIDLCKKVKQSLFYPGSNYKLLSVAKHFAYPFAFPDLTGQQVGSAYSSYIYSGEEPDWQQFIEYNRDDVLSMIYVMEKINELYLQQAEQKEQFAHRQTQPGENKEYNKKEVKLLRQKIQIEKLKSFWLTDKDLAKLLAEQPIDLHVKDERSVLCSALRELQEKRQNKDIDWESYFEAEKELEQQLDDLPFTADGVTSLLTSLDSGQLSPIECLTYLYLPQLIKEIFLCDLIEHIIHLEEAKGHEFHDICMQAISNKRKQIVGENTDGNISGIHKKLGSVRYKLLGKDSLVAVVMNLVREVTRRRARLFRRRKDFEWLAYIGQTSQSKEEQEQLNQWMLKSLTALIKNWLNVHDIDIDSTPEPSARFVWAHPWEIENWFFCNVKAHNYEKFGETKTQEKQSGTRLHTKVEQEIAKVPDSTRGRLSLPLKTPGVADSFVESELSLCSVTLGVLGKLDLLICQKGSFQAYEIKRRGKGRQPPFQKKFGANVWESHAFQLILYGLLVEERFGPSPELFVLYVDEDRQSIIDSLSNCQSIDEISQLIQSMNPIPITYSEANKEQAQEAVKQIRRVKQGKVQAQRNHNNKNKCRNCEYQKFCTAAL